MCLLSKTKMKSYEMSFLHAHIQTLCDVNDIKIHWFPHFLILNMVMCKRNFKWKKSYGPCIRK